MINIEVLKNITIATQLSEAKQKLIENAPFHFNLIDEVKANENAHSKIIGKLLRYKEYGKFVNLISFLDQIGLEQTFKNPRISVERERIDITILGKDYAIIIENKIHYATDQDEQISRYVEIIKAKSYPIDQIYVLYLTRWGHKKPDKKSLDDNLREKLGDRFIPINFKDHILPWLEDVLTKCRQRDQDLIHGLEQYIDHLNGIFNLRKKDMKMNKELNEFIANQIGFEVDNKDSYTILEKKISEFELVTTHLNSMRVDIRNKSRRDFLEKLFLKLNKYESGWTYVNRVYHEATIADANSEFFGFSNRTYQFEEMDLPFSIEINKWKNFLCGVFCNDLNIEERLSEAFREKEINIVCDKKKSWVYLDIGSYHYDKGGKIGWIIYDDLWNKDYLENMDTMVDIFYDQVIKVFEAWKKITKKS